jgi:hypothetical protein
MLGLLFIFLCVLLAIAFDVSTNPLERGKFKNYVLEYKQIVPQLAAFELVLSCGCGLLNNLDHK